YSTAGLQSLNQVVVENVLPDVSDFLGARRFEDFDETTDTFIMQELPNDIGVAVEAVGNRYLIVSYSTGSIDHFTHAIVVDNKMQRIGKLKVDHVGVFPYRPIVGGVLSSTNTKIGFFKEDASAVIVNPDIDGSEASGVILFGKFQYVRQRWIQLQQVELENGSRIGNIVSFVYYSYRGKDPSGIDVGQQEHLDMISTSRKSWFFSAVGKNLSLLIKGGFDLISLVIHINLHGKY